MIRAFLAASSPVVRAGLEALLVGSGAVTIVGASSHSGALAEELQGVDTDVVILVVDDLTVPPLPLMLSHDDVHRVPAIVVLVHEPGPALIGTLLRDGARAVLPRDAQPAELLAAVEAAAAGLVVVAPEFVVALSSQPVRATRPFVPSAPSVALSPREAEILGMLAEGLGNKIIAARLGISEHTVKTHVASVFAKLGAETRAEAVAIGVRHGLIPL